MNEASYQPTGDKFENALSHESTERLIDYDVEDSASEKIGTVHNIWAQNDFQPTYLGVKTGWLFGKIHVVPLEDAQVNHAQRIIRLPYAGAKVKDAPTFDPDYDILDADQLRINEYYGTSVARELPTTAAGPTTAESAVTADVDETPASSVPESVLEETMEKKSIPLREEELVVGKRQVEAGGVRLRKIVRTETVNQPVELKREEIVIERTPASTERTTDAGAQFGGEDIFIPLRREEAVVGKTVHVRENVNVGKRTETDKRTISEEVRSEDVEIEQNKARP